MALSATNLLEVQAAGIDDYAAVSAVSATQGTGYSVNDVLTLVGGTSTTTAQFTVTAVNAGAVTAVSLLRAGAYTVLPANPVATTGGGGAACTLTVTWNGAGNGGGFDPANANMATDLVTTNGTSATPTVSSASYNFTTRDINHWLFTPAGTGWIPGWYKITSTPANTAVLDAAVGHGVNYPIIAPSTVAGCATSASPGGNATWSIDYSQTATPGVAFTDMVEDGTVNTKFTSAGNPVGVNFVGNLINVYSGTNWTVQRVQVVSVSGTTATCDKSLGTLSDTGGKGNLGGCLASLGKASLLAVASNTIWCKGSANQVVSVNTVNVPLGKVSVGVINTRWFGYTSFRGDGGRVTVQPDNSVFINATLFAVASAGVPCTVENFITDSRGPDTTVKVGITGFTGGTGTAAQATQFTRCRATRHQGKGFGCTSTGKTILRECEIDLCGTTFAGGAVQFNGLGSLILEDCYIHDNTTDGLNVTSTTPEAIIARRCIFGGNASGTIFPTVNITIGIGALIIQDCEFWGNGVATDAVKMTVAPTAGYIENNIVGNYAGFAVNATVAVPALYVEKNTIFSVTSGMASTNVTLLGSVLTLTASPWVSPSTGNFTHTNTTGGGASVRGKGYPGLFPGATVTGYADYGAVQHQEVSASQQQFQYQVG